MAVEKLMGIEIPKRAQYIRVILSEFSRIMDHLTCIGPNLVDLGALTNYWYTFQPREEIYGLLESCCGGRLTVAYARIGGLSFDVPDDFADRCRAVLKMIPPLITDVDELNRLNPIFQKRTREVGALSPDEAVQWGWTGPCLRACGVPYDVRKAHPYYDYDQFDFDVPVGTIGDTYDRYLVRMEEIRQSMRLIEQYLEKLPGGPVCVDDYQVVMPPKDETYARMEQMIYHFKLVMHGIQPPAGEVYSFTEAANGELGYYLVSDGTKNPYRIKVRPPCYPIFQAFGPLIEGGMIADAIAILGSVNIIAGELDR
jgi:NADH:ubiquinone oxidoreductase subunit D